jgi:membrane protease YdiL (CAAX protease family)
MIKSKSQDKNAEEAPSPETPKNTAPISKKSTTSWRKKLTWALAYGLGIMAAFYIVQYGASFALYLIYGQERLATLAGNPVIMAVVSAVVYATILAVVLVVPHKLFKQKLTVKEMGVTKWPTWTDLLLSPAAFIAYLIGAALLTGIASGVLPWFDANQVQDVGYRAENLVSQADYLLAFVALVVVAPIAEELIFRGYLYGKLRSRLGIVASMLIVSVLFGVAHGQWNVGVNVFAMSLVMCGLREITDSIWAGTLLHMLKNGVAYYLLFVNPALINGVTGG